MHKHHQVQDNEPTIFIHNHQGLGDMIVANAIFRHFAETHNVVIPVKKQNVPSVQFMLRGLPVALFGVEHDEEATRLSVAAQKRGVRVLKLGMFNSPFDEKQWDKEFYRVAGIPFEKRWSDWTIDRELSREFKLPEPPSEPYMFVHDDEARGFVIDTMRLPDGLRIVHAAHRNTDTIFDYCRLIENATELHMIDSCFAILADSLPNLKAKKKVIHLYSRKGALPPTYRGDWEILK